MELGHFSPPRQVFCDQTDFATEKIKIRNRLLIVRGDDDVASTEQAAFFTKRQVDVDRQRLRITFIGGCQKVGIDSVIKILLELHRSGVARIPRTLTVIAAHQLGGYCR